MHTTLDTDRGVTTNAEVLVIRRGGLWLAFQLVFAGFLVLFAAAGIRSGDGFLVLPQVLAAVFAVVLGARYIAFPYAVLESGVLTIRSGALSRKRVFSLGSIVGVHRKSGNELALNMSDDTVEFVDLRPLSGSGRDSLYGTLKAHTESCLANAST